MRSIPYLGPTGVPFHKLNDAQKRGFTRGMTEEDAWDLDNHFAMIGSRVEAHQAERQAIKKQVRDLLVFPAETPAEERARRAKEVGKLKKRYEELETSIVSLKATEVEFTPGEPLALEPIT